MRLEEVARLVGAKVYTGEELLDVDIDSAFASDMMSDVLAYAEDQALLLTGLNNPQAVRTALMLDMSCILFVRGKEPAEEVVSLAKLSHIAVLATALTMYEASGRLYAAGLHR